MRFKVGIGWWSFLGGRSRRPWRLLGRGRRFCCLGDSGRLDLDRLMIGGKPGAASKGEVCLRDGESGETSGSWAVWGGFRVSLTASERRRDRREALSGVCLKLLAGTYFVTHDDPSTGSHLFAIVAI